MRRMLLLCAIALAAGCGDKPPSCERIAEHVAALATAELDKRAPGADAKALERLELEKKMIPIGQATTREQCKKERWGEAKIRCHAAARSMEEVARCE